MTCYGLDETPTPLVDKTLKGLGFRVKLVHYLLIPDDPTCPLPPAKSNKRCMLPLPPSQGFEAPLINAVGRSCLLY